MILKLLSFFRNVMNSLKMRVVRNEFKAKCTLIGSNHNLAPTSRVTLWHGSTKEDVILHDHCEPFGIIYSINHGKVIIHEWAKFGERTVVEAVNKVEIGKDTAIATDVTIIDNNCHPLNPIDRRYMRHTPHGSEERSHHCSVSAPIIIGENVWIGPYSRICKGVTIGDNAIIGANSVVTHDVPANSVAAGNPAKIVKTDIDKSTSPIFPLSL